MIWVTSPPRTGNNFLNRLIQSNINNKNIQNIKCQMNNHDSTFLIIDNPNTYNLLILRDPKDVLISQLIFSHTETSKLDFENLLPRFKDFEQSFINHLQKFKNINRNNNYWLHFNDLINHPEQMFKNIIKTIGEDIEITHIFNPSNMENNHYLINDIYKSPFVTKRKELEEYKNIYIIYENIVKQYDLTNSYNIYYTIINDCANKRIL